MRRVQSLTVIVAATFALAACGSGVSTGSGLPAASPTSAAPTPAPEESAEPASAVVPQELKFTSTTTTGDPFEGSSLAGKPTVVWFWAPWCHICQNEASGVASAAKSSDVEFLGVAALDSAESMRGFVKKYGLDFTNLADTDAAVWAKFGVTSQPAFAFVSATGDVEVVPGSLSKSELKSRIAELEKS